MQLTDLVVKETAGLTGTVNAPSSKALTHRALIAASLSDGRSKIKDPLICDDTLATIDACRMMGAEISRSGNAALEVQGRSKPLTPSDVINCRDSAATMRFIAPVSTLADGITVLTGGESLRRRPMEPLLQALRQLGVQCYSTKSDGCPPLVVFGGGIEGGRASIRGDISSQFISGLLFALPIARADTNIVLSMPLESKPYVDMTLNILVKHEVNVDVKHDYGEFRVPCGQRYMPFDHTIEGDYSSAAFLMAAAVATSSHVKIENLSENSLQGDRLIVSVLEKMGVQITVGRDFVEVQGARSLKAVDIDLRDTPDLIPVCTVFGCLARGKSLIRGVRRLRFKESDRTAGLVSELGKLGADVKTVNDVIIVNGGKKLRGAELDSHGDHRIAMACAVAALKAEGTTVLHGIECINKSYPDFVRDMISVGGRMVER